MLTCIITDIKYKDQLSNKLTSIINESNIIKLKNYEIFEMLFLINLSYSYLINYKYHSCFVRSYKITLKDHLFSLTY